ncbi:molybdopterin-dependent oxidoreductase [Burkholderia cenocepacia]|uniref:molybdopterin-dependent oxidoreductase n=1 Tax=Burkholderia cenocepacia TaxID=95486 RepID=UPI00076CA5FF|nr:molybdopterin-dependent oxidoreductase [Burkholderia cenocepacia]KWU17946.1 hypothetical protein AS149_14830 [Burkholderia cenocepacia]
MKGINVRQLFTTVVSAGVLLAASAPSYAETAFLTISGNITAGTGHKLTLTQAQFDALPQHNVSTSTSWTKGVHTFTGPLLRDIQKLAGSKSKSMDAFAVDDYVQQIPTDDFTKYDVILADKMDGKALPMDHYGPMWVIYPRDDFKQELVNPMTDGKFVWQVDRVVFK